MQISLWTERGSNGYVSANVTESQLYASQRIAGFTKTCSHNNSLERERNLLLRFVRRVLDETRYIKYNKFQRQRESKLLRRELVIILRICQRQPAHRLVNDLGLNYKTARRFVQPLRKTSTPISELEANRLKRQIESGEAHSSKSRVVVDRIGSSSPCANKIKHKTLITRYQGFMWNTRLQSYISTSQATSSLSV